jgi:NAD+ synthase
MKIYEKIKIWLENYLNENNLSCFIVGISGGIDSSVVSTLCSLTGKKTIVVTLPIHQDKTQYELAKKHINWLESKFDNVTSFEIDLTNIFNEFKLLFNESDNLSLANTRSRLRMTTLYQIASMNNNNGIVVGTGNKVEDFGVGFFTKYGDGGVDISPIADLNKTEVRLLAKELGIIDEIIIAKPTDGLWDDNRNDEDQIGATYEELEKIMNMLELSTEEYLLKNLQGRDLEVLNIFLNLHKKNKHKMVSIPVFKIK